MEWYEILVIVVAIAFVLSMIAIYVYKRVNNMPTGECACCANKGKKLVKAYHKKKAKECCCDK